MRYSKYRAYSLMSPPDWEKSCTRMKLVFDNCRGIKRPRAAKERARLYTEARSELVKDLRNIDLLGGNHLCVIYATLEVIPVWYAEEIDIAVISKSMKWLLETFIHDKTKRKHSDAIGYLANIAAALEIKFEMTFSKRMVENILCKVYRIIQPSGSDTKYRDIIFQSQTLCTVTAGKVVVVGTWDGNYWLRMKHLKDGQRVGIRFEITESKNKWLAALFTKVGVALEQKERRQKENRDRESGLLDTDNGSPGYNDDEKENEDGDSD